MPVLKNMLVGRATIASTRSDSSSHRLISLGPEDSLDTVTRYFATYNLVCGPVVDAENHLLGAVSVDDLLDELLPRDWRETDPHPGAGPHATVPAVERSPR